jgi:GPI mannosyltransferase 3
MNPRIKPAYVYLFSILALGVTAWFAVGYYFPDEHFQILEFAGYKLSLSDPAGLPWEFHSRIRPALQPAIAVALYELMHLFGEVNPFTMTFLLRLLSALMTFLVMFRIYQAYQKGIRQELLRRWFLWLSFLLWFAISAGSRFSSENWSGITFSLAFAWFISKDQSPGYRGYLFMGLLAGLSFLFRYQSSLLIAGFFLWLVFIKKESLLKLLMFLLGIVLIAGAGLLLDRWFYGEWTLTAWNYFNENILLDKVSGFGLKPWWYYLYEYFVRTIPPFSLVFILSFPVLFLFRWKDPLTWTLIPFLAVHFLIGHKEVRFLFPLFGFVPIVVIRGLEVLTGWKGEEILHHRAVRIFARLFWAANFVALAVVMFYPAESQARLYQAVYELYPRPVTLYYTGHNPYFGSTEIFFYKRKTLKVKEVISFNEINQGPDTLCLFVTKKPAELDSISCKKVLAWSAFPSWVRKFDFNGWVERTSFWSVYEVRTDTTGNR